jgi:hypothetical protein
MRSEEKILFAGRLLELIRELEDLAIDYCRILTSDDDGHLLEKDAKREVPF